MHDPVFFPRPRPHVYRAIFLFLAPFFRREGRVRGHSHSPYSRDALADRELLNRKDVIAGIGPRIT